MSEINIPSKLPCFNNLNKVIPLVYDDSLSYYELYCKMVNSYNELVDEVNELVEYINNVYDSITLNASYDETNETVILNIEKEELESE